MFQGLKELTESLLLLLGKGLIAGEGVKKTFWRALNAIIKDPNYKE